MGRFHRHPDGTVHEHGDGHHHDHQHGHEHAHDPADLGDHSKYETGRERISVLEDIYAENDHLAAHNREAFEENHVTCINVMSSPGAGKTALLRKVLEALEGELRIGIVEGDIETSLDAERLEGFGAHISLLNTGDGFGGECHLDAPMVHHALEKLDLSTLDLVLIENVGNLVCPAEFEVGEHHKAMVFSVTEGEDKPLKYPVMFHSVDVVVINKIDLLPYLDFDMDLFRKNLEQVNPGVTVIEASAKTGEGVEEWVGWLRQATKDRVLTKDKDQ